MTQVRAVYEFEAQPNSGELSISVDEVLTVLREVCVYLFPLKWMKLQIGRKYTFSIWGNKLSPN